jgi:hypothetical protein
VSLAASESVIAERVNVTLNVILKQRILIKKVYKSQEVVSFFDFSDSLLFDIGLMS